MRKFDIIVIVTTFIGAILLYFVSLASFVTFHITIESIYLVFSSAIFLIANATEKIRKDSLIAKISPGILVSSILVYAHAFFYPGIGFFNVDEPNVSTQIWLISNLILSISILIAVVFYEKKINLLRSALIYLGISAVSMYFVFQGLLPDTFTIANGLTLFKIIVEYIIILIFIASIVLLYLRKEKMNNVQYLDLVISLIMFIVAEFIFTLYSGPTEIYNFMGHLIRILAILYLYKSAFIRDLNDPLDTIFLELNSEIEQIKKQAEMVRKSESIFKSLYEKAPLGYQSLDESGHLIYANDAYAEMLGYSKGELIGKWFGDLLDGSGFDVFDQNFKVFKEAGKTQVIIAMKHKDGTVIPVRFVGRIARDLDGAFQRTHCILMDISHEMEYQKSILSSEEKLSNILNSTAEGIYGVDKDANCVFANKNALRIIGYKDETEIIGLNWHKLVSPVHEDGSEIAEKDCAVKKSLDEGVESNAENVMFARRDGSLFPVEYNSVPQFIDGEVSGAVVSFKDISERKELKDTLVRLSYRDNLTNVYNRRYYNLELKNIDERKQYPISLIMGDINGLKLVNDAFGHKSGDELLIKAANIIQKVVGKDGLVARVGGDEFVVVLGGTSRTVAENKVFQINESIKDVNVNSVPLSISFGIATKENPNDDIEEVFKSAEDAMYRQKLMKIPSMRSDAIETILNTLHEKDENSEMHSRSVSEICERIALAAELDRERVQRVKTAGLLHDIGKIVIPSKILNKNGKLTKNEYEEVIKHSEIGFRILNSSHNLRLISEIVLSHHEKFDGTGYPMGLSGEDIPYESRIVAIADAFDAMTTEKNYKTCLSMEEAMQELQDCSGKQFDPDLVKLCVKNYKTIFVK